MAVEEAMFYLKREWGNIYELWGKETRSWPNDPSHGFHVNLAGSGFRVSSRCRSAHALLFLLLVLYSIFVYWWVSCYVSLCLSPSPLDVAVVVPVGGRCGSVVIGLLPLPLPQCATTV